MLNTPDELSTIKGLRIVHLNVCSLISKIDELRHTLIAVSDIDILCITETWLKPHHDSNLFNIPGYVLFRLDRTRISRSGAYIHGGGLACYVKINYTSLMLDLNISSVDLEMLTLSLKLPDQRTFFVSTTYRPPSGNYHVALNKISDVINQLRLNKHGPRLLLGEILILTSPIPKIHRH